MSSLTLFIFFSFVAIYSSFTDTALLETSAAIARELDAAQKELAAPKDSAAADEESTSLEATPSDQQWNAHDLLLHRLHGLRDDACALRVAAGALARSW